MTDQELQLEAYKILVSMLQKDDELFWKRNDVLIAINGGLITVVGFLLKSDSFGIINTISAAICLMGIAACIFWFLIAKRGVAFYDHWYEQLKDLEIRFLKPINIFNTADDFFETGQTILGERIFKLNKWARLIRMFTAMQYLSIIFGMIWIFLGIYLIFNIGYIC